MRIRFVMVVLLQLTFLNSSMLKAQNKSPAKSQDKIKISICNDEEGWPPFTYRISSQNKGVTLDILDWIFSEGPYEYTYKWTAWKRCLNDVKRGAVDIAADLYDDPERRLYINYSAPIIKLNSAIYFLSSRKDLENISSIQELHKFKACGKQGYSYQHFQLRNQDFSALVNSHNQLFLLLDNHRCDYFPEEKEVIAGLVMTRQLVFNELVYREKVLPWIKGPQVFLGVSSKSPYARQLLSFINKRISQFNSDPRRLKQVLKKNGL